MKEGQTRTAMDWEGPFAFIFLLFLFIYLREREHKQVERRAE